MQIRSRGFHRGLFRLWAGGWAVWVGLACMPETPARPSLVLLTVDRLAADRLGCFGGPPEAGSSLCALAAEGLRFGWATTPSLGEASAAATLLTGLPPEIHGLEDQGIDFLTDRHETIAESLARAGYATAAFVASPRLNRARRLDQGFAHYEDRPLHLPGEAGSDSLARASAIQEWIETAGSPFFVWIHVRSEPGLGELDRLIDRLASVLRRDADGPGLLFAALAGEPSDPDSRDARPDPGPRRNPTDDSTRARDQVDRIELSAHRVPLLWLPPATARPVAPAIRFRLASLLDVLPTLRAAASLSEPDASSGSGSARGRDLSGLALEPAAELDPNAAEEPDVVGTRDPTARFLLLKLPDAVGADREVGLASERFLYVRRRSPLDGSGQPVPASDLRGLEARYAKIEPRPDGSSQAAPTAALAPPIWQREILRSASPVPRLELHLARLLADPESSHAAP